MRLVSRSEFILRIAPPAAFGVGRLLLRLVVLEQRAQGDDLDVRFPVVAGAQYEMVGFDFGHLQAVVFAAYRYGSGLRLGFHINLAPYDDWV